MKRQKLTKPTEEHREALALLAGMAEFKAFEKLCAVEEHNIVYQSFKINSSDVDIIRKKAWMEGRLFELRNMLKIFRDAKKGDE